MSWDLFVRELPPGVRSVAEIPDDFRPAPLGTRAELIERIRVHVPAGSFADPAWGVLEAPEFSIEFNMGEEGQLSAFALHVRGGDVAASPKASAAGVAIATRSVASEKSFEGRGSSGSPTPLGRLRHTRALVIAGFRRRLPPLRKPL